MEYLTVKEMSNLRRYDFRFVTIRRYRNTYEVYNEVDYKDDRIGIETIEQAVEYFNTVVEKNTKYLEKF